MFILDVEGSGSDFEVDEYGKNGSDCEEEDDEEWAEEEEEKEGENQTAESGAYLFKLADIHIII